MSSGAVVEAAAAVAQTTWMPVRRAEPAGAWSDSAPPPNGPLAAHHATLAERGELAGARTPGNGARPLRRSASAGSDNCDPGRPAAAAAAGAHRAPNRAATPRECTMSPVSWRHNPYGVSPRSPVTLSASTTQRQSPWRSTHSRTGSTVVNDAVDCPAGNEDVTDAPSIRVCTRSGRNGRRRSGCMATPEGSAPHFSLCDGEGRFDEELATCISRSSAPSGGEDQLLELQPQQQCPQNQHWLKCSRSHPHNVYPGQRNSRANSVQSAGRISVLRCTPDTHAVPSLSRSLTSAQTNYRYPDQYPPSHPSELHLRTFSHQSAMSSTVSGSFAGAQELMGVSRSLIGHNAMLPEEAAAYRPFCSPEAEPDLGISQRSMMDHFPAHMPLPDEFCTHRSSSPQHSLGGTNVAAFTLWSLGQTRSATPQEKEELDGYGSNEDSRMIHLEDDDEIEAYNTTLRPNEVNAPINLAVFDDVQAESPSGGRHPMPKPTATESPTSTSASLAATEGAYDNPNLQATTATAQGITIDQQQQQEFQQTNAPQTIDWNALEQLMLVDPSKEVMCFPGCTFSVYDSAIHSHYLIDSTDIVATHGSVEYLKMNESRGSQSRFRFQLCKRYLNRRCTRGANCPYIHTHAVPAPNFVHINENAISAAVVEGLETPPEELRGGKNSNRYPTMPSGAIFRVFPPNQGKSVPQLIPSEMILRTVGASNVYSVLEHSGGGKARDAGAAEAADAAGYENGKLNNVKARHCAHFQFNKMCNLGEACNFIHSLVPYLQRLSVAPQNQSYAPMMPSSQPFVMPSAPMAPFTSFPNGANHGGLTPPYPMEFMRHPLLQVPQMAPQQPRQPQQHVLPPAPVPQLLQPPHAAAADHVMYQRGISMVPLPMYVPSPLPPAWNGVRYAANYP
ncbi:uncharacterized protein Tco025E_05195 [Trypanosoma conorhini]|uniref:C3H1-type domain-containing protein n=1 Tax=Trypanosoma conorhini TaxID=83891 RepID=A0A422PF67_9TRYP|nr:uncharacterized protein Tco025E_05195 [Trypanosoma conorhini]RNF16351.1 hypothetical protein Tco025E_05195 [Trypanosoma conorhini]